MAEAVELALQERRHLVVEAGTVREDAGVFDAVIR